MKNPSPQIRILVNFLSAVMDLVYLIFTVIRNGICRGILDTMPTWMAIIYPHFIYPMYYISLFCTVQMVVAISIERPLPYLLLSVIIQDAGFTF